ncbi:MAG: AraC family transcriptional regulator [Pseudomonadota bacterium]
MGDDSGVGEVTKPIDALASFRFDSDDYRPTDRLDAMKEVYSGLKDCSRVEIGSEGDDRQRPTLKLRAWSLGVMAASSFESAHLTTKTTDSLDPELSEMLFLRLVAKGQIHAESGDEQILLRPGQIYMGHARHTLHRVNAASGVSLLVPYADVGYDPCCHPRIMAVRSDMWFGRVVEAAVHTLFEALPGMTPAEAQTVQPSLTALVRALLRADSLDDEAQEVVRSHRAAAMRQYVVANLQDQGLSVQRLQAVFGASRTTVYRAFEDVGGVARFVREQRLHAIYRRLCTAPPTYGVIRTVAEEFGFSDQSVFTRAFRSLHGVRPSDVIGTRCLLSEASSCVPAGPSRLGVISMASFWSANSADRTRGMAA